MLGCVANGVAATPSVGESLGYVPRGQGAGHGDSGGYWNGRAPRHPQHPSTLV